MLTITALSKTYPGGIRALEDITLTIPKGIFGLLGPNGAGKSTLMRTVATLQDPDSGAIRFGEIDVLRQKDALRRRLGYLPQEFGCYPGTSAETMLNHLAVLKGIVEKRARREVVESLLERCNLAAVRKRNVDTFSGGMRQRFGIAQALIGAPELLVVDEPTAGLDPAERRRFQNLLARVGEDVVVILSTHIVEDITDLCPRMAVLGAGRILLEGEPRALTRSLRGRLWVGRVGGVGAANLDAALSDLSAVSTRTVGGHLEVRAVADAPPAGSFAAAEPTLEDVYFATLQAHGLRGDVD